MEQIGHLLVELANLLLQQVPLLKRHLHQSTINRIEFLACAERIRQLLLRGTQAPIAEGGERRGVTLSLGERLQDPSPAEAQQVRDQAGQLDVRFFQQSLQPVV